MAKNPSEGYAYLLLPLTCFCPGEEALSEYLAEGQAVWAQVEEEKKHLEMNSIKTLT